MSPRLQVGANVDVLFGILENGRRTTFDDDDAAQGYGATFVSSSTRLVGVTGTVGALLTLPGVLGEGDALTAGATFTLPTRLSGDRVRTLGESLDRDTLGTKVDGSVDVPLGAGLGLAYRPDARWTVLADGRYEPWSAFSSTFALPGYTPGDGAANFQDRLRLSAGVELVPAGADFTEAYFRRTAYRLGFYYDDAYLDGAQIGGRPQCRAAHARPHRRREPPHPPAWHAARPQPRGRTSRHDRRRARPGDLLPRPRQREYRGAVVRAAETPLGSPCLKRTVLRTRERHPFSAT